MGRRTTTVRPFASVPLRGLQSHLERRFLKSVSAASLSPPLSLFSLLCSSSGLECSLPEVFLKAPGISSGERLLSRGNNNKKPKVHVHLIREKQTSVRWGRAPWESQARGWLCLAWENELRGSGCQPPTLGTLHLTSLCTIFPSGGEGLRMEMQAEALRELQTKDLAKSCIHTIAEPG